MIRHLILAFLAFLAIPSALGQGVEDLTETGAYIEAQARATVELETTFQSAAGADFEALNTDITMRREDLTAMIERLQLEQSALQLSVEEATAVQSGSDEGANDGVTEIEAGVSEADTSTDLSEQALRLASLESLLADAERVLRDLDSLAAGVSARAQKYSVQVSLNERTAEIDAISRRFDITTDDQVLTLLREELRALRTVAQSDIEPIKNSRSRLEADLERLGPEPGEGEEEASELADAREHITMALVEEDNIVRQSASNVSRINQLLTDIAKRRRLQFYSRVFTRGTSPINGELLASANDSVRGGLSVLKVKADGWAIAHKNDGGALWACLMILAGIIGGIILFFPVKRWISLGIAKRLQKHEPTPARRAFAAVLRTITRAGPAIIGGLIVFEVLRYYGVFDADTVSLARAMLFGVMAIIAVEASSVAILSPSVAGWRLMPVEQQASVILRTISLLLAFVFFADRALSIGAATYGGTQELALMQSAATAITLGALIFIGTRRKYWQLEQDRQLAFSDELKQVGSVLRTIVGLLGAGAILATLIGYVSLGYFITTRIVLLGAIFLLGFFSRLVAQGAIRSLAEWFEKKDKLGGNENVSERLIFFWFGVLADFLIALAIIPFVIIALGAEWVDVRAGILSAFFGFKVGSVTISFAQILIAFVSLIFVMMITRFIQRVAEKQLFPKTRLDSGVQNSLRTIIGYVGLIIAVMTAVSVLGFNMQNLAIIAGALSLGIGFGLQSIVNNFVSGLILLFERPVKVGDWIVVGSGEGVVKRISVRSTEIETLDRSSIIVPNSELISSSVQNWTHKDRWTRVTIPIGVSYDAHPQKVLDLLDDIIKKNKSVMTYPASSVFFAGFGDNSLDFEMRIFLRDPADRVPVQNQIRVAIYDTLKEAGIEIPFPQRDLHLKANIDGVIDEALNPEK